MSKIVNVSFCNRSINLFQNKSDITTKQKVTIHKLSDKGFFYVHNNKFFDAEGRFDISFDQGVWNAKLLKSSILA